MNYKSDNQGYTLVELLVSLTIIAVIGALVITNYHDAGQQSELRLASRQVATHIRQTQNKAMSSQNDNCALGDGCAWGIYFTRDNTGANNTRYIVFEDANGDLEYTSGEESGEPLSLPPNVVVTDLLFSAGHAEAHITFLPPDPVINLCWDGLNCENFMNIELSNSAGSKQILINKFGLVDVN